MVIIVRLLYALTLVFKVVKSVRLMYALEVKFS